MPGGISGIELARKVRDRFPELPILLTTGYSERSADRTASPCFRNPMSWKSLRKRFGAVLKQEIAVN